MPRMLMLGTTFQLLGPLAFQFEAAKQHFLKRMCNSTAVFAPSCSKLFLCMIDRSDYRQALPMHSSKQKDIYRHLTFGILRA